MGGLLIAATPAAFGQGGGPVPVGVTEAIEAPVRGSIELTGTVGSRQTSVVASEVAGLVVSLDAREGDLVDRGAPLVVLRRQNLELRLASAAASLEEAKARRSLAETSLGRARKLFEDQVISRQQLDDAISEAAAWEARVEQLTAERRRLEDDLERSAVRAPFAGVVVEELTAVGEWISAGGPVAELMDFDDLEVTVDVPERHFSGLAVGGTAFVSIESLGGLVTEGRIRAVVPRADPRARSFPVKIDVDNSAGDIGVGMLARVTLPVGEERPSVMVPKDAIVDQLGQKIVYVVDEGSTVRPVPVETGIAKGEWISIEGSIEPGSRVVTRGNERLRPGQAIESTPEEYEQP